MGMFGVAFGRLISLSYEYCGSPSRRKAVISLTFRNEQLANLTNLKEKITQLLTGKTIPT